MAQLAFVVAAVVVAVAEPVLVMQTWTLPIEEWTACAGNTVGNTERMLSPEMLLLQILYFQVRTTVG